MTLYKKRLVFMFKITAFPPGCFVYNLYKHRPFLHRTADLFCFCVSASRYSIFRIVTSCLFGAHALPAARRPVYQLLCPSNPSPPEPKRPDAPNVKRRAHSVFRISDPAFGGVGPSIIPLCKYLQIPPYISVHNNECFLHFFHVLSQAVGCFDVFVKMHTILPYSP